MLTVKEFLKGVYPLLGKNGLDMSVGIDGYIPAINMAMDYIYTFKGLRMDWTIRTSGVFIEEKDFIFHATTPFPIIGVGTFFRGVEDMEYIKKRSLYPTTHTDGDNIEYAPDYTDCTPVAKGKIKMKQVGPGGDLAYGTYKIDGGQNGFGGTFGNRVSGRLPQENNVGSKPYFTYAAYFNPVTNADSNITLPRAYTTPLTYLVVADIIGRMIQFRNGDDLNYIQKADRLLDNLANMQVNIPQTIFNSPNM